MGFLLDANINLSEYGETFFVGHTFIYEIIESYFDAQYMLLYQNGPVFSIENVTLNMFVFRMQGHLFRNKSANQLK